MDSPSVIFQAEALCMPPVFPDGSAHAATKKQAHQVDVQIFKLKEFVKDKEPVLHKVSSFDNVANCLTKSLSKEIVDAARCYMLSGRRNMGASMDG
jgi:hypothetical protein